MGVGAPNYEEDFAWDELPFEADFISREENKEEFELRKCKDVNKSKYLVEDCFHEPHHLIGKLKVSEEKIMTTMKFFDDTHALVADCFCRAFGSDGSLRGKISFRFAGT